MSEGKALVWWGKTFDVRGVRRYRASAYPSEKVLYWKLLKCRYQPGDPDVLEALYQLAIPLHFGDIVHLDGQAEATNDVDNEVTDLEASTVFNGCNATNVLFGIHLAVNGERLKPVASINITPDMHHCPLRVATVYEAKQTGVHKVELIGNAAINAGVQCSYGPHLSVEGGDDGYGGITAMVFR